MRGSPRRRRARPLAAARPRPSRRSRSTWRAVPDEVPDRLQREVGVDEPLHARVPERVRPRPRNIDLRRAQIVPRPLSDDRVADRLERRDRTQEHPPLIAPRTTVLQIVHERFPDRRRERERGRVPGLALRYPQMLALPIDVIQHQRRDLSATQPVGDQQHQDRPVTLAARRAAFNPGEHAADLLPGDRPRDAREPVRQRPLDRAAEIAPDRALAMRVAQEHPQRRAAIPQRLVLQPFARAISDERAQDRRRELRELRDTDPLQKQLKAPQMMPVAINRHRPQPTLQFQVLKETGHRLTNGYGQRIRP